MRLRRFPRPRAIGALLPFLATAGCGSVTIDWPAADRESICPAVQVVAHWTGELANFRATLDNVDVTSEFTVGYANKQASAQLDAAPGSHTLVVSGRYPGFLGYFGGTGRATRTFEVPGLALSTNPQVLALTRNGSRPLTVVASGCGGGVSISLSSLPSGVTATPAAGTINVPAPSNPGISGSRRGSMSTTIRASATSVAGRYPVNVNGSASGQTATTTFSLELGRPTLTSVAPAMQSRGGTVTLAGTGFDPACANNTVTLAGVNVTPSVCSPGGTSVTIPIPPQAAFGATTATLTVGGLASNGRPLTVTRRPGAFIDITGGISSRRTNHACSNADGSPGNVRVEFTPLTAVNVRAAFLDPTRTIGSVTFAKDRVSSPSVLNAGGAGFSACVAGVVLNAGVPEFRLVSLESGAQPPSYPFSFVPTNGGFVGPEVLRSQDGSVIALVTAGTAQQRTVAFVDVDRVNFGDVLSSTRCQLTGTPSVNASNAIELRCGTAPATTIPIP